MGPARRPRRRGAGVPTRPGTRRIVPVSDLLTPEVAGKLRCRFYASLLPKSTSDAFHTDEEALAPPAGPCAWSAVQ
ncbi:MULTISPECIES: hypothetical protein [Cryobacterium]|uniref:Uncharacterized protein n=1 Tax=Cryobacterium breve TaxID=1259258 RepID=A0ABY2J030_9MICO|nr:MULTISPECIES: hypothetical protein [Cryobacterium]TFC91770.1 hypothetical protein E3T20_12980 [Cryobacterium sp. TmT3-12]TFC98319.1 hypothetical protein E3O65_08200 [Cryobacterium breve]